MDGLYFRLAVSSHEEITALVEDALMGSGTEAGSDWRPLPDDVTFGANVLWTWGRPKAEEWSRLVAWQKINHFPNTSYLTRKDMLKRAMQKYTRMGGRVAQVFDITPLTYVLPSEYVTFVEHFSKLGAKSKKTNLWIMKPAGLSRGRGIFLFNDISQVVHGEPVVVQKYIANPLLLHGRKFDLRIYALVTSFEPLEAFVYKEGFARVSTVEYDDAPDTLGNNVMHLTNTSIQSVADTSYTGSDDTTEWGGSKCSLKFLAKALAEQGISYSTIWKRICSVVLKTLYVAKDSIESHPNSFEVFGFDIMFDADLRAWLIEVNSSPSMACDNPLDSRIKGSMVADTLKLVNPLRYDRDALSSVLSSMIAQKYRHASKDQLNQDIYDILRGGVPRPPTSGLPSYLGLYHPIAPSPAFSKLDAIVSRSRKSAPSSTSSPKFR